MDNGGYGKAAQLRQKYIDEYQRLRKLNPNMPAQEAGINFTALGVTRVLHVRHVRKTLKTPKGQGDLRLLGMDLTSHLQAVQFET